MFLLRQALTTKAAELTIGIRLSIYRVAVTRDKADLTMDRALTKDKADLAELTAKAEAAAKAGKYLGYISAKIRQVNPPVFFIIF